MAPRKTKNDPVEIMVVNDSPGEECRIAILLDGHLEELYTERTATATSVGNIYKGRVVNVEPAIQAAFIDFGHGQNGFLHISDLHPRYFEGGGERSDRTERVGRKVPFRNRPPIQEALRRGDEVLVQVMKEGLGTKGPTLTSYLSIPGRLMVAMPYMDKVGVSRKIDDEDKRREMRKALDQIELPPGFGFILRTAGFGRPKTELKRDVAYLTRLWKAMERRRDTEAAPCELYTESDLLVRTIRDVLRPTISAIVVDSDSAYDRATEFLQVAAPRSAPKVIRYRRKAPIFHAFDVERQIELIHCREVPLPSGGALVIEQTEAMVAIDVNSGRSRSARDAETNAYQTNCEAVDEICRQLRLRDLGGLIVNDLIDMRAHRNRRLIEDRVRENLKRDRAKSTALKLSDFGLLEMTRQRMRPSIHKSNFVVCSHCNGHGEIKSPEYVAADAVRQINYLLQFQQVAKVEVACSPRVASVLLSGKRREMVRIEDETQKRIEVRVSDSIASDRVDFYAYDSRNADIAQTSLPKMDMPDVASLEKEDKAARKSAKSGDTKPRDESQQQLPVEKRDGHVEDVDAAVQKDGQSKRRRGRRGGRGRRGRGESQAVDTKQQAQTVETRTTNVIEAIDAKADTSEATDTKPAKGRKRRSKKTAAQQDAVRVHDLAKQIGVTSKEILARSENDETIELKSHMSSVNSDQAEQIRQWFDDAPAGGAATENGEAVEKAAREESAKGDGGTKRRRGRRGGRRRNKKLLEAGASESSTKAAAEKTGGEKSSAAKNDKVTPETPTQTEPKRTKRRTLYGSRTKVSPSARAKAIETSDA